jgi:membrane protease YdiL (CAAX protease family)
MERGQTNLITFKGCRWLLLSVFYLQFLVAEVLEMNWSFFSTQPVPQLVTIVCVQLFAVALPSGIFLFLNSARPSDVCKREKLSVGAVLTCMLAGIAAQPVAGLCNLPILIHRQNMGIAVSEGIATPQTVQGLIVGLLVVALLPAVFEEFLMRGILLHSLERQGYRVTLFLSAFFFALLHNRQDTFFGVFFLGLLLCYAVWMTQSIFAGMIVHFSFNAFGMLLDFVISQNIAAHPWLGGQLFQIGLIVSSLIVLGVTTSVLNRSQVRRYKTHSFWKQAARAVFNLPVLLILFGYFMFDFLFRFLAA